MENKKFVMVTNQTGKEVMQEETAPERQNMTAAEEAERQADLDTQLRAQALVSQAQAIRAISGVDVMALYETDMEIRQRVLSGEWDFMDVWKNTSAQPMPPKPVRAANGSMGKVNIIAMNSRQFEKLNEMLGHGGTVDMRN